MTVGWFCLAALRLAAILLPAWMTAHVLRARFLGARGATAALVEVVLSISVLLLGAELLGVLSLLRFAPLVILFMAVAGVAVIWDRNRPREAAREPAGDVGDEAAPRHGGRCAVVAVVVVAAQWCLGTANTLGVGMLNFDTLWYHMPFAARFAETGSITGIQFTQADPYVAYYPANSELFHALGIVALHNDFLSPLMNLVWLAVALLAAWCLGSRWRVERLTLIAGALVMSLPVMSTTQPGQARNDTAGLALMLAGIALVTDPEEDTFKLLAAGLALGFAVGTKYTFIIPAAAVLAGVTVRAARGRRARTFSLLAAPLALTGGFWYLRALVADGNPLGLHMHLGPISLPGPVSPLANAQQQTVASELGHLSLWGSRFAPALYHTLGPLWPVVLLLYIAAVVGGLAVNDTTVRLLALTAGLAGASYLFFPTGATQLAQQPNLFEANLRYAAPALALGALLVPVFARARVPGSLALLGPALLVTLLVSQLEPGLLPAQTLGHLALIAALALIVAAGWGASKLSAPRLSAIVPAVALALIAVAAGAFALQRHYFSRRYLRGDADVPGLGAIYRWAQSVSHVRIGLYGSLAQYPLYGARDTNVVDYLGARTGDGGYAPIPTCGAWRTAIDRGRYQYLVLMPAPTGSVPLSWSAPDPGVSLVLHPAASQYVFRITQPLRPGLCD